MSPEQVVELTPTCIRGCPLAWRAAACRRYGCESSDQHRSSAHFLAGVHDLDGSALGGGDRGFFPPSLDDKAVGCLHAGTAFRLSSLPSLRRSRGVGSRQNVHGCGNRRSTGDRADLGGPDARRGRGYNPGQNRTGFGSDRVPLPTRAQTDPPPGFVSWTELALREWLLD